MLKDYVFGDRKFGGNAQSIIKHRWIHHTSFLWDYDNKNMSYLKLPAKAPKYRSVSLFFNLSFLCSRVVNWLIDFVLPFFFWLGRYTVCHNFSNGIVSLLSHSYFNVSGVLIK